MHKTTHILTNICLIGICALTQAQIVSLADSERKDHHSFFPLMRSFKEKAIEAGAEFPKPYGLAGSVYYQQQQMEISKIRLGALEGLGC